MLGFFKRPREKKTEQGVKRTRDAWWGKVVHLFDSSILGDDLWDELEELLIAADVGMNTTTKLITRLKERVEKEKIGEASEARSALKEEIISMLTVSEREPSTSQTSTCSG